MLKNLKHYQDFNDSSGFVISCKKKKPPENNEKRFSTIINKRIAFDKHVLDNKHPTEVLHMAFPLELLRKLSGEKAQYILNKVKLLKTHP